MNSTRPSGPPIPASDRSAAAVRAWVAWYTGRLPVEIAAARRELVEADLFEEARAAEWLGETGALGRQRVSRLVRGIPADLTWRLEQGRRAGGTTRSQTMRISKVELVVVAAAAAVYAIGLVASFMALANPDPERWAGWGPYGLAAGLGLAIVGLLMTIPRPAIGLGLGVAGTVVLMSAMPWAFFIFLPVPLPHWFRFARSRSSHPVPASAGGG